MIVCSWLQRRPQRPASTWRPSPSWRDSPSRAPGEDPPTSVSPSSCSPGSVQLYEGWAHCMSKVDPFLLLQVNNFVPSETAGQGTAKMPESNA